MVILASLWLLLSVKFYSIWQHCFVLFSFHVATLYFIYSGLTELTFGSRFGPESGKSGPSEKFQNNVQHKQSESAENEMSVTSCLTEFPDPICDNSICEFDSVLLPTSRSPTPRPDQIIRTFQTLVGETSGQGTLGHHLYTHDTSSSLSGELSAKNAFLPPKAERQVKHLLAQWWEEGFSSVIDQFVTCSPLPLSQNLNQSGVVEGNFLQRFAVKFAKSVLAGFRMITNIHSSFNPHLMMSGEDMIFHFSETRDWASSLVRALAWHPHTTKYAIAYKDDTIEIHGLNLPTTPLLKYKKQKCVSCLAWRPFNASDLAVGCQVGIILWSIEPSSVAARPSASAITLLAHKGHAPVTSLSWDPKGKLLLSSSPVDTSILIWNPSSETKIPMRRIGGGGIHLVSWSQAHHVLAATPSTVFRIWETKNWTDDRWNVLEGHIRTSCWSPCGNYLLFSTTSEPVIFMLNVATSSSSNAVPIVDLSKVEMETENGVRWFGGTIQSMKWDPLGERLAVTFVESGVIAIFCTNMYPNFSISPIGLIGGLDANEKPSLIEFAGKFDEGALLTIIWSSGRFQNVPLLFVPNLSRFPKMKVVLNPELEFNHSTLGANHSTEIFSIRD